MAENPAKRMGTAMAALAAAAILAGCGGGGGPDIRISVEAPEAGGERAREAARTL